MITRRHLQLSLALLWLLDGALQCQPYMFSVGFARNVLAPASMGQPALVATPMHWASTLVAAHPLVTNGAFATVQLGLGVALLSRRHARLALSASIVWALSVWFVGEGLGGIAGGGTLLAGAPGAALLYAVLACLAWPTRNPDIDQRPSWLAVPAWGGLWLVGAGLQLAASGTPGASVAGTLRMAESASPRWVAGLDGQLLRIGIPSAASAALIATFLLIALWVLVPGRARTVSIWLGVAVAIAGWVLVQGMGDLTSGQATDPNAGPLIVLLAVAAMCAASRPARSSRRARLTLPHEVANRTLDLTHSAATR